MMSIKVDILLHNIKYPEKFTLSGDFTLYQPDSLFRVMEDDPPSNTFTPIIFLFP